MTLIKSISGIRGTIGGLPGEGLTPLDTVKFTAAFAAWIKQQSGKNDSKKYRIIVGRDARLSGEMVRQIVLGTLSGMGIDVIDIGLATTPTVEVAVTSEKADGGIILTASHNPKQWNALKLLNRNGEFLSDADGKRVLSIAENNDYQFANVDSLGKITGKDYLQEHIDQILKLKTVDINAIAMKNFKVAIDCVNSVGGMVLPKLLKALGVKEVIELFCEPNGIFPHNPEPLPEHLAEISKLTKETHSNVGFVVDPDVDRLALICEDGTIFGEEYTLVSVADYILSQQMGNTCSNLSSSRALRDITEKRGGKYVAAAVGEVNVVTAMKQNNAIIGGEGNGGVIYPELHYGRDALVGIALFLTHLAKSGKTCSQLRAGYPEYYISKNKIELTSGVNVDDILLKMKDKYKHEQVNDIDGVKIDFASEWVHLRKSNTEPIIRVYAESKSKETADKLALRIIQEIKTII